MAVSFWATQQMFRSVLVPYFWGSSRAVFCGIRFLTWQKLSFVMHEPIFRWEKQCNLPLCHQMQVLSKFKRPPKSSKWQTFFFYLLFCNLSFDPLGMKDKTARDWPLLRVLWWDERLFCWIRLHNYENCKWQQIGFDCTNCDYCERQLIQMSPLVFEVNSFVGHTCHILHSIS